MWKNLTSAIRRALRPNRLPMEAINAITVQGGFTWDPTDPSYSTNGKFDPAKLKAGPGSCYVKKQRSHIDNFFGPIAEDVLTSTDVFNADFMRIDRSITADQLQSSMPNPVPIVTDVVVTKTGTTFTITTTTIMLSKLPSGIVETGAPIVSSTSFSFNPP